MRPPDHHASSRAESSLGQLPIIWRTSVRCLCAPREFSWNKYYSPQPLLGQVLASCIQLREAWCCWKQSTLPPPHPPPTKVCSSFPDECISWSSRLSGFVLQSPAATHSPFNFSPKQTIGVKEMWFQVLWLGWEVRVSRLTVSQPHCVHIFRPQSFRENKNSLLGSRWWLWRLLLRTKALIHRPLFLSDSLRA